MYLYKKSGGFTLVVRITLWVLRVCVLCGLILGIILWTGNGDSIVGIHMLLGILTVLSLWVIAVLTAMAKGGNWGLSGGAIVLGLVVTAFGLTQKTILPEPNSLHWIIQIVHLLLGLSVIGIAEAMAGRYKRMNAAKAVAV